MIADDDAENPSAEVTRRAEQALLGSVLTAGRVLLDRCDGIEARDFSSAGDGLIWKAICTLDAEGEEPDPLSVADWLDRRGWLSDAGGRAYLSKLEDSIPDVQSVGTYARIVQRRATERRLARWAKRG